MSIYNRVAKTVEPKRKKLAKMNAELDAANATLKEKQDQLAAVIAKVEDLQRQLDETISENARFWFKGNARSLYLFP